MKTKKLLAVVAVLLAGMLSAQQNANDTAGTHDPWRNTRAGNESFKSRDYTAAEQHYRNAIASDTMKNIARYNLGNALYRLGKYDSAAKVYSDAANGLYGDTLANAWHNLGNALLQQKKYDESIDAYKKALRMNPGDENTRYNLAYAESMLKKKSGQGGNGGQMPTGNQQKSGNNSQGNNNHNMQANAKQNNGSPNNQGNQKPQPQTMSKDEAQRMLSALRAQEQKTRQKMSSQQLGSSNSSQPPRHSDKDW